MKENTKKPTIAIVSYSRAALLRNCLNSLLRAQNIEDFNIVIVQQIGNDEVEKVIQEFSHIFQIIVKVSGLERNTIQNISFNRLLAAELGFSHLRSEYVLNLEDDVEISADALRFVQFSYDKYSNDVRFRGVNLGSLENLSNEHEVTYSRIRFGVQGPAFALTRNSWRNSRVSLLIENDFSELYDGYLESYVKTGYMITPNKSRVIDLGVAGTHTPESHTDPYFARMAESFVGDTLSDGDFMLQQVHHSWRYDAFPYRPCQNLIFEFKFLVNRLKNNKIIGWPFRKLLEIRRLVLQVKK